ncbi:MAG: DNA-processing protein DprA, partial [Phormidesmis sp.]
AAASELLTVDGIGLLIAEKITAQRPTLEPAKLLAQHEAENPLFWTPADPDYPALLFTINDPPPVLYYRGNLRLNEMSDVLSVGIVGTRRPSMYGKRWTQRLSNALTRQGAVIISGLAAGIDTVAHTSCLQHRGLTVAVLGTGVDVVYPRQNQSLYQQILAGGLIVSEYPDGSAPDKTHFPQRNRIIAGLSRALLVTEAPARSGALITARLANDYCREVYALPGALDNVQGEGCLHLIDQGAQMILGEQKLVERLTALPPADAQLPGQADRRLDRSAAVSVAASVAASGAASGAEVERDRLQIPLGGASVAVSADKPPAENAAKATHRDPASELSPLLCQVLAAVPMEPRLLDHIVSLTQVETGDVLSALMQLELLGLVTQLPGMQYQRM